MKTQNQCNETITSRARAHGNSLLTMLTAISFSHRRSSRIPALFTTMSISSISLTASSKAAAEITGYALNHCNYKSRVLVCCRCCKKKTLPTISGYLETSAWTKCALPAPCDLSTEATIRLPATSSMSIMQIFWKNEKVFFC